MLRPEQKIHLSIFLPASGASTLSILLCAFFSLDKPGSVDFLFQDQKKPVDRDRISDVSFFCRPEALDSKIYAELLRYRTSLLSLFALPFSLSDVHVTNYAWLWVRHERMCWHDCAKCVFVELCEWLFGLSDCDVQQPWRIFDRWNQLPTYTMRAILLLFCVLSFPPYLTFHCRATFSLSMHQKASTSCCFELSHLPRYQLERSPNHRIIQPSVFLFPWLVECLVCVCCVCMSRTFEVSYMNVKPVCT